jgi:hypothetical protein
MSDVEFYLTPATICYDLLMEYISAQLDDATESDLIKEVSDLMVKVDKLFDPEQLVLIGECCGAITFVASNPKGKHPLVWFKEGIIYCTDTTLQDVVKMLYKHTYIQFEGTDVL